MMRGLTTLLVVLALAGCKEEAAEAPPPVPLTEEAVGFFCQMTVLQHGGPKGQVHLEGMPAPLFFSQARDALAYLRGEERIADITAIYVSDMAVAPSWAAPGIENWIAAEGAHFVVGAAVAGGMGLQEIVPFSDPGAASDFAGRYGGEVLSFDAIPNAAILAPIDFDMELETPS